MAEELEDNKEVASKDDKEPKKKPVAKKKKQDKEDLELVKNSIEINPKLEEAANATVVLGWGRMNPITIGHEKLIKKIKDVARKENAEAIVYLTHSQNSKKDPLSYSDKIRLAQKAFGKVVQKSNSKTIIQVMQELQKKFKNVILVVGSDRIKEFETLLNKYNGKDYTFDSIKIVSAGERDADADGVEGMSASKMREAASTADNVDATWIDSKGKKQPSFRSGLPKKLQNDAQRIWDMVRTGLKLVEELEELGLLDEAVLSLAQRRQRAITMRKYKSKIAVARKRASKKAASSDVIKKRARKQAVNLIKKQVAGAKGKSYSALSAGEKMQIDKRVAKRKSAIERIAKRLIVQVKRTERERLSGAKTKNEEFETFLETVEMAKRPKYHEARKKDGTIKLDGRFKIFRKKKDAVEEDAKAEIKRIKNTHARQRKQLSVRHERELDQAQTTGLRKQIRKVQTTNQVKQEDVDTLLGLVEEVSEDIITSIELAETKIYESLKQKAEKHFVDFEEVWEVYQSALNEEPKHDLTLEQHAFATVNVYLSEKPDAATMAKWDQKKKDRFHDAVMSAMHRLVTSKGTKQSIGGYAFDIARSYGLKPKEVEKMYRSKYNVKESLDDMFTEAYGDMDRGTPSLTKKYMKDTPHQEVDSDIVKAKDGSYTYKGKK